MLCTRHGLVLVYDADTGARLLTILAGMNGWAALDAQDRWSGEGQALDCIVYEDANDTGLIRTEWHPEDLPELRAREPSPADAE